MIQNRLFPDCRQDFDPVVLGQMQVQQNNAGIIFAAAQAMIVNKSQCRLAVGKNFEVIRLPQIIQSVA